MEDPEAEAKDEMLNSAWERFRADGPLADPDAIAKEIAGNDIKMNSKIKPSNKAVVSLAMLPNKKPIPISKYVLNPKSLSMYLNRPEKKNAVPKYARLSLFTLALTYPNIGKHTIENA